MQGAVQAAVGAVSAVAKSGKGAVLWSCGGVQAGVQTAVARSGKGAVQGAVQACCEAAAYSFLNRAMCLAQAR